MRRSACFALFLGLCLFMAGCAAGSGGRLTHSKELMGQYRDKGLAENYTYYYCGRANIPYAVVGIDPAYTFDSRLWFKIDSRDEVYRKISNLSNLAASHSVMFAKNILSPTGAVIGTWFSFYNTTAIEVDEENKEVNVFSPYKPGSRFTGDG